MGILVLQTIEHHRAFVSRLIAECNIRVLIINLQKHFSNRPPIGLAEVWEFSDDFCCAHERSLTGGVAIVICQFRFRTPSSMENLIPPPLVVDDYSRGQWQAADDATESPMHDGAGIYFRNVRGMNRPVLAPDFSAGAYRFAYSIGCQEMLPEPIRSSSRFDKLPQLDGNKAAVAAEGKPEVARARRVR